jgi:hypothetical protein
VISTKKREAMNISKKGAVYISSLMISAFLVSCVTNAVTQMPFQTHSIRKESKDELRNVKSVYIDFFKCQCEETIPLIIQSSIIETFLPNGVSLTAKRNDAEAIIEGVIAIVDDSKSGVFTGANIFSGSHGSGIYVSAVTARVTNRKGNILAMASATQVRSRDWVPDPPPLIGRWVGEKLVFVLTGKDISSRRPRSAKDSSLPK